MSHEIEPVLFQWQADPGIMVPAKRHHRLCNKQYTDGGTYYLGPHGGANSPADKAYFAEIGEAWKTLPEPWDRKFPSADHLRKYALIKCGYHRHEMRDFETPEDAKKAALMIRPFDRFAVITVDGCNVHVFTAQSQRRGSGMDDETRKKSQRAVLDWITREIGVTRTDLRKHTEKADHD